MKKLQKLQIGADRWNFILDPTMARRSELLRDAVTVVVEGGIWWTKGNRADVYATASVAEVVEKFPPSLVVWAPLESGPAWRAAGIQWHPLQFGAVMGPYGVPRHGGAFFAALDLACERLGAKQVRVFGASSWARGPQRWKRWALANCMRLGGAAGVAIERV